MKHIYIRSIFYLCLLLISVLNGNSETLQYHQASPPNNSESTKVLAIDSSTFIIAHSLNSTSSPYIEIEKTTDYGQSWKSVYKDDSLTNLNLYEIDELLYLGDGKIWAQAKNDRILESTNYGETWEHDFFIFDTNYIMGNININDGKLACIVWPDTFAISTDKGKTWDKNIIKYDYDTTLYFKTDILIEQAAIYGDTCVAVLEKIRRIYMEYPEWSFQFDSQLIFSTDRGKSWIFGKEILNKRIADVKKTWDNNFCFSTNFQLPYKVIKSSGDTVTKYRSKTQLCKTEDFCKSYDTLFTNEGYEHTRMFQYFADRYAFLILSDIFLISKDNCQTFYEIDYKDFSNSLPFIQDSDFLNSGRGMVTFDKSYATLEDDTSINELYQKVSDLLVYPNPISIGESIHIRYNIKYPGEYSYSISDLTGSTVNIDLEAEYLASGSKEIEIQLPNDLSSGTYFLNILHNSNIAAMVRVVLAR